MGRGSTVHPSGGSGDDNLAVSRLDRFVARTEAPLDFLALVTLWIVMLPIITWGAEGTHGWILFLRLALTAVYALDFAIRIALAEHHWEYARHHWISGFAAILPPIRIFFSVRLVGKMFRRGNLMFFLGCSFVLLMNFAIVVYTFEHEHPQASIQTPGEAIWWAFVTVATVGYGDYVPISLGGRIVGVMTMTLGVITLAVVTAQVASSFMNQRDQRHTEAERLHTKLAEISDEDDEQDSAPLTAVSVPGGTAASHADITDRQRILDLEAEVASLKAELARRSTS